ncbi:MAG: amino acid ABC transporter ATP-binding protein [Bauldia sp.]|nr:amino acid ABC transporter ATP-binding protein [Bauldia sp.]
MTRLQVERLTKFYGEKLVLDGIDLSVAAHEVVALIGASGSGKSTLLRCINRLVDFDAGRILLDGVPIDHESFGANGLYRRVGIVFQSFNLFPHLSVLQNITLAPRKVHGVPRREAEDAACALLAVFGMSECVAQYPEQLSGGQQQRVAIIRSLANNPDVLLLDEVTGALDPELIGEVLKIVRDLKDKGMTMVIVTHEMGFARDVSDRVCYLEGGRIIEDGAPAEVFTRPQHPRTQKFLERIIASGRL